MNWGWTILLIIIVIFIILIIVSIASLAMGYGSDLRPPFPPTTSGYYYSTTIGGQVRWLNLNSSFLFLTANKPDFKFTGEIGKPLMYNDKVFINKDGTAVISNKVTGTSKPITIAQAEGGIRMEIPPNCYMYTYTTEEQESRIYLYKENSILLENGVWKYQYCGSDITYTQKQKPILLLFTRSTS